MHKLFWTTFSSEFHKPSFSSVCTDQNSTTGHLRVFELFSSLDGLWQSQISWQEGCSVSRIGLISCFIQDPPQAKIFVTLIALISFTKQHPSFAEFSDKSWGRRGKKGHSSLCFFYIGLSGGNSCPSIDWKHHIRAGWSQCRISYMLYYYLDAEHNILPWSEARTPGVCVKVHHQVSDDLSIFLLKC